MTPPSHVGEYVDEKGNDDNAVCAKPLSDKTFEYNGQTYQVYDFIDNTSGSQG